MLGQQLREFTEPNYSTDPANYTFDLIDCETESPKTFPPKACERPPGFRHAKPQATLKVFRDSNDAIDFAYCCNLDSVWTLVYDRIDGVWVESKDHSAFDIDW